MRLPPDAALRRPRTANAGRRAGRGAGRARPEPADDLLDDAVLLASELCENAVLHAGTEFELAVTVTEAEVTVAVTDRGRARWSCTWPSRGTRYGRAATHGRGLALIAAAGRPGAPGTRPTAGTRSGSRLARGSTADRPPAAPAVPGPGPRPGLEHRASRPAGCCTCRPPWCDRLEPDELVAELVRRLRELLGASR